MKREPIKIPGRTAELLSRTEAHHHVIDDDRHFLVLENAFYKDFDTLRSLVFQEFNNDELGPPFRMIWAEKLDWPDTECEPVRAEVTLTFVPDGGAEV